MTDVWRPGDRPDFLGPILLDTHVWIWYLEQAAERMAPEAAPLLRRIVASTGALISDISVWEIGLKASKGKLALKPNARGWIDRATALPGFAFLPLDRAMLLLSTELPRVHSDPADRMLIAAASLTGVPLATADPEIIGYARSHGGLSVCDVRIT